MASKEIDPKQLKHLQNNFVALSEKRLLRMLDNFNMVQADCIKLLPLLFHVNHPMLPGYVDKATPCGIPNYSPDNLQKKIVKTISRSFEYKSRAYLKFDIAGLFLMGSTGTLGQSIKSDLDLWICLAQPLAVEEKQKLVKKTALISDWLMTKGVELNGYLVQQNQFKQRQKQQLDKESCGNAQHYLLLDEFYRTAVWICGRQPLWWLIPVEENYQQYASHLLDEKRIEPSDWIDFGEIDSIPPAEYLSAALWQLYKAIASPYKSSLKLLLLEVYARYLPQVGLISNQYKKRVHEGESDLNNLDPYILMLGYAESFLEGDAMRLEFLRRAFYLKTGIKIQLNKGNHRNWRYQQIKLLVERWGWNQNRLDYLNNRVNWQINEVLKERVDLVRQLNHSYHFISNFARVQGVLDEVGQTELIALGRMLYATFERRTDKIDCVNHGIAKNINAASVTVYQSHNQWQLLMGAISPEQFSVSQSVNSEASFFEMIVWCVCNQIVNNNSNFQIFSNNKFFSHVLARHLVRDISGLVNHAQKQEKNFSQVATTQVLGVFLNTMCDPLEQEKQSGIYSVSENQDSFSWGKNQLNLLQQFNVFWSNSWGEYCTKNYAGEFAWIEFFIEHRQFIINTENQILFFNYQFSELSQHRLRVFDLFRQWNKWLTDSIRKNKTTRFLMSIGDGFLRIDFVGKEIKFHHYQTVNLLLVSLSEFVAETIQYQVDQKINLPANVIKILNKPVSNGLDIYIIQKQSQKIGVLFKSISGYIRYCEHNAANVHHLVNHYQQFFDSIYYRINASFTLSDKTSGINELDNRQFWYAESSTYHHTSRFNKLKPSNQQIALIYSPIQAVARLNTENKVCFNFYVDQQQYLYQDYGELVYRELVKYIFKQRNSSESYPIFITDIDLTAISHDACVMDYLDYKSQVENKILSAMNRLVAVHPFIASRE
ncbi:class I adenylate cyclase [Aliikangiella maris]|uniref:Class I adenylate cyclase n=2 Tax=Aliikangiella maris TaxID=3162458 RepID=A0ABV3MQB5_9GAMM